MGRPVARQRRKILRVKKSPVPNLDPVAPASGQLPQKLIQRFDKLPPPLELARRKVRELEDQQADVRLKLPARAEERRRKQAGIQEILIGSAGAPAKPRQVGKALDRDPVRHLEREQEIRRRLRDKLLQQAAVGKLVVSRIHADRLEHFRILRQA